MERGGQEGALGYTLCSQPVKQHRLIAHGERDVGLFVCSNKARPSKTHVLTSLPPNLSLV